jgi:hypothetical protein
MSVLRFRERPTGRPGGANRPKGAVPTGEGK